MDFYETKDNPLNVTGIVLAGGKGQRLGCLNKASEVINNKPLLGRVVSSLDFLSSIVIVTSNSKQVIPQFETTLPVRKVVDFYPDKGPLGGIYSGLENSQSTRNLVVACDMPFLNQNLLKYLIEISDKFDVVVPRSGECLEPLHAVYSKSCINPIKQLLKEGNLNIRRLFDMVKVRYVTLEEIERFDSKHLSFFNINTVQDLNLAKTIMDN